MLPLFLVLSYLGQVIAAGKDVETPLLQITVPEKIDTNIQDAKEAETQVTYVVRIEGKAYTLQLEKQSHWTAPCRRVKPDPYLSPCRKLNSTWL